LNRFHSRDILRTTRETHGYDDENNRKFSGPDFFHEGPPLKDRSSIVTKARFGATRLFSCGFQGIYFFRI
jgi:hypothetical protein